jgi:hypothetical protein
VEDENNTASSFHHSHITQGNRLERYVRELPDAMRSSENVFPFLKKIFKECLEFTLQYTRISSLPRIRLFLVFPHSKFMEEFSNAAGKNSLKEVVKYPELVKAFTVGPRFSKRIYIDLETHISLLKLGGTRFTFGLVSTYFHEIIHTGFRQKSEQEVFDMQNLMVRDFLGVTMPDQWRNLRVSDYYDKKTNP